ncbi:hypothetical protein [Winogradskyella sp.]|uniref:hypothetical protein n=1 Tax=Winogradskyella sp. TaxID=1883156 RepID=UPI0025DF3084|nr:hypothetical protein [Winogradskyella sp.]MBT8243893.1 hypothetical protein [Winogradskyella sp.]
MFKFKSLGIIAICALSFTFMSFSSSSDDLYDASYYSNIEKGSEAELNESAWVAAAARLAVAGSRYAVRYTREVVRVSAPFVNEAVRQLIILAHTEGHSNELYAMAIDNLKDQQMRNLD